MEDESMITYAVEYSYGRSPDTIGPSYVKNVHRNGAVMGNTDGSVIDSYGRRSPDTSNDYVSYAWYVKSDGDLDSYNYVDYSYGYIFDYFCI